MQIRFLCCSRLFPRRAVVKLHAQCDQSVGIFLLLAFYGDLRKKFTAKNPGLLRAFSRQEGRKPLKICFIAPTFFKAILKLWLLKDFKRVEYPQLRRSNLLGFTHERADLLPVLTLFFFFGLGFIYLPQKLVTLVFVIVKSELLLSSYFC